MKRRSHSIGVFLGASLVAVALISVGLGPNTASAASPCHTVEAQGAKIRVAVAGAPCELGREVAVGYFARVLAQDHFDGKTANGSIFYEVDGFRCLTGLAGSQMYCHHHDRRIFASDRPEDRPSTWRRVTSAAEDAPLARRVNFVIGCSGSVYEPKEIALSCADGKVRFQTGGTWDEWGPSSARTHGTVSFPDCSPKTPLITCSHYVEEEAIVRLWRPVYCPNVRHWQFTRLRVEDPVGAGPEGFNKAIPYPCNRFKPAPIHRLGASAARSYMRSVMSRFSYQARAGGGIKCNRRLSSIRRLCKMGWVTGDSGFIGRGKIWLTFRRHEKQAHFSYRLTLIDEYCLYVTHEGDCTKKRSDSGLVPGQRRSLQARSYLILAPYEERKLRLSYWSECAPASYQVSILVHKVDCARARMDIERLYEKGQERRPGNAPYVKVNGFECFLDPRYGNPSVKSHPARPVTCRRADKVINAAMP